MDYKICTVYSVHESDYVLHMGRACQIKKLSLVENCLTVTHQDIFNKQIYTRVLRSTEPFTSFTPVRVRHTVLYVEGREALTDTDHMFIGDYVVGSLITTINAPVCIMGFWGDSTIVVL